jgi:hypothetical protein
MWSINEVNHAALIEVMANFVWFQKLRVQNFTNNLEEEWTYL